MTRHREGGGGSVGIKSFLMSFVYGHAKTMMSDITLSMHAIPPMDVPYGFLDFGVILFEH